MPDIETHQKQAAHNERLAMQLAETEYSDWAVTAVFYAALHHVDAYLHTKEVYCRLHPRRDAEIARNPNTRPIYKDYGHLKMMSEDARYNGAAMPSHKVKEVAIPKLEKIKNHLRRLVTPAA